MNNDLYFNVLTLEHKVFWMCVRGLSRVMNEEDAWG